MAAEGGGPDLAGAVEALLKAEKLIASVDRAALLERLDQLHAFVEELSRLQLDLRMARLRLAAYLPSQERQPQAPSTSTLRIGALPAAKK